jgi:hypothetical protein
MEISKKQSTIDSLIDFSDFGYNVDKLINDMYYSIADDLDPAEYSDMYDSLNKHFDNINAPYFTDFRGTPTKDFSGIVEDYILDVSKHSSTNFKNYDSKTMDKLYSEQSRIVDLGFNLLNNNYDENLAKMQEQKVKDSEELSEEYDIVKVIKKKESESLRVVVETDSMYDKLNSLEGITVYKVTELAESIQKEFDLYISESPVTDGTDVTSEPINVMCNATTILDLDEMDEQSLAILPVNIQKVAKLQNVKKASVVQNCMSADSWYKPGFEYLVEEDQYDRPRCVFTGRLMWHLDIDLHQVSLVREYYETETLKLKEKPKAKKSKKESPVKNPPKDLGMTLTMEDLKIAQLNAMLEEILG